MATLIESPTTVVIDVDRAYASVSAALVAVGATEAEAAVVTDVLLTADLRGQHSHGVLRLPTIVGRVRAGLIRPGAEPLVERPAPAVAMVDGAMGFGHAIAMSAIRIAEETARQTGIALVGVRNNNHIGMLGYYCEAAARDGFVTLLSTTTEAFVHPHGGAERLLGTNPIAIGVPSDPDPFVLDCSTSATAIGKIIDSAQRGVPIRSDWALDAAGEVTTDPNEALAGSINPFGGVKGYGLGLAMALLAGIMLDTAANPDVVGTLDTAFAANKGDLIIAIDPSVLPGGHEFRARTSGFLDLIRRSKPAPGHEQVLVPGDRGRAERERSLATGVVLPSSLWLEIEELGGSGV